MSYEIHSTYARKIKHSLQRFVDNLKEFKKVFISTFIFSKKNHDFFPSGVLTLYMNESYYQQET